LLVPIFGGHPYVGRVGDMQAVALLTQCLKDELVASDAERGALLLQLGKHLHDLGQTSRAVQVNFTCSRLLT